ncbi:MAG: MFS transporter [Mycobacterium sp.]
MLAVRGSLPWLLISSWMWHLTRWYGLFLGTYFVTAVGAPPIANQFVGVLLFAPMLLGAYAGRVFRNSGGPRKLVLVTELVLLPVSIAMDILVVCGAAQIWAVYVFEFAFGFGLMVSMTAQRELLLRVAGPSRATRVLNIEIASGASAMMLGPLVAGITIGACGLSVAFAVPAVLLAFSVLLFWGSIRGMSTEFGATMPPSTPIVSADRPDRRPLWRTPALGLIMLLTLIFDLFYFAFTPLIPVIAEHLGTGAAMAGVLGAMPGLAQLVVSTSVAIRPVRRLFTGYAGGVAMALSALGMLAYAPAVGVALAALGLAGLGQGLLGSTQATLTVEVVEPQDRADALGLLTTAIGLAVPIGMVALGVTVSLLGAQRAMLASAVVGLVGLAVVLLTNRGLLRGGNLQSAAVVAG